MLCYIYMMKRFEILRTTPAERKFDSALARTLMYIGVPMGLQFSITAIGSIMLQSANNALGTACSGFYGCHAYQDVLYVSLRELGYGDGHL